MFNKLADYTVLEVLIGNKVVSFLERKSHMFLTIIIGLYFLYAFIRYRQLDKLIKLEAHKLEASARSKYSVIRRLT